MTPSCLVPCRNVHLMYLCDRMRPDEIEQYLALTGNTEWDAETALRGFLAIPGVKFTILDSEGLPAAAGGYHEILPGVFESWMVGSMDGWGTRWRSITKATRWLIASLMANGARRLQTHVLASRTCAIEWYERGLGLTYEGTLRGYGANGEAAAIYARVKE